MYTNYLKMIRSVFWLLSNASLVAAVNANNLKTHFFLETSYIGTFPLGRRHQRWRERKQTRSQHADRWARLKADSYVIDTSVCTTEAVPLPYPAKYKINGGIQSVDNASLCNFIKETWVNSNIPKLEGWLAGRADQTNEEKKEVGGLCGFDNNSWCTAIDTILKRNLFFSLWWQTCHKLPHCDKAQNAAGHHHPTTQYLP